MRALLLVALAVAAPPAGAAQHPRTVEVRLSNFDFTPHRIVLRAGEPVVLHLVNTTGGGHDFSSPSFFAAARTVSGPVHGGKIEVPSRGAIDVHVTPARGSYRLRCTHTLHATLGMTGRIVVQ